MQGEEIEYFWEGLRRDGRKADELREIRIEAGVLERADGSALVEWGMTLARVRVKADMNKFKELQKTTTTSIALMEGDTMLIDVPKKLVHRVEEIFGKYEEVGETFKGNKVVAAVYGPREPIPRHVGNPYHAIVRYKYTMAPFSVPERKSPKPSRREIEISKVSGEALQYAIFANEYPMTVIDVFTEVLASHAGTRVTCLTAAAVAMADAGIPMRDLIVGLAVGRAGGQLIVDLTKEEEDAPDAVDLALGILPRRGEVVLMQMDGQIPKDDLKKLLKLGREKAREIYELQKQALKRKYERVIQHE